MDVLKEKYYNWKAEGEFKKIDTDSYVECDISLDENYTKCCQMKDSHKHKLKFILIFILAFSLLLCSIGYLLLTVKSKINNRSCSGLFSKHEFPKYGTALLITKSQHLTIHINVLYGLWRKFGVESILISKTLLEGVDNDRIQKDLVPLIEQASAYGITFGVYIDDIFYLQKHHPWYQSKDHLVKVNAINNAVYQVGDRRVLNFVNNTQSQDLYIETFTRYIDSGFKSFIFAELPYTNVHINPQNEKINKSMININFLSLIRDYIIENAPSKRTYIGLDIENGRDQLLEIIPYFSDYLCAFALENIEIFPNLDYTKLTKEITKRQQLSLIYKIPMLWQPNRLPIYDLMRKMEGVLLTHIIHAYLPGGSIIHISDLLLEPTDYPIKSMISKNVTNLMATLQNVLFQIRKLQYCKDHFDLYDRIGVIREKLDVVFIPRENANGVVGSYLVINSSNQQRNVNIEPIVNVATEVLSVTSIGMLEPLGNFNLTNVPFSPYGAYIVFTF